MSDTTIGRLREVFRETFPDDAVELTRETGPNDIQAWDSVMHINLIIGIESEFGIRFSTAEIIRMTSVGAIAEAVETKASA